MSAANLNELKQMTLALIKKNRAASLATVNSLGIPHSSIVYCLAKPDLSLYFMTRVEARKYKNIQQQPKVSLSFYNEDEMVSIQMTGIAEQIMELKQEQQVLYELVTIRYAESNLIPPPMQLFEKGAALSVAVFKVKPEEMTYANFGANPQGRFNSFFYKVI